MGIGASMAMELNYEAGTTRKYLEIVPVDKLDWRPHPKSMTLGGLVSHLAQLPSWAEATVKQDEFVLNLSEWVPFKAKSIEDLLAEHDQNVAAAAAAIDGVDDAKMMEIWTMKIGDKIVMQLPRVVVLRNMILNHMIHHRAQLGVYLRLNDIALPRVYGPTADDPKIG